MHPDEMVLRHVGFEHASSKFKLASRIFELASRIFEHASRMNGHAACSYEHASSKFEHASKSYEHASSSFEHASRSYEHASRRNGYASRSSEHAPRLNASAEFGLCNELCHLIKFVLVSYAEICFPGVFTPPCCLLYSSCRLTCPRHCGVPHPFVFRSYSVGRCP